MTDNALIYTTFSMLSSSKVMKQLQLSMEQEQSKKKEEYKTEDAATWTSLTKDFCGYTSAHGLERIMSSKEWIKKAFWSLLFIGACVVLGFQVYTLFEKYQRRPLNTLITLKSDTVSVKENKQQQQKCESQYSSRLFSRRLDKLFTG